MDINKILKKYTKYYLYIKKSDKKVKLVSNSNNKNEMIKNFKSNYLKKIKKESYNLYSLILIKIKKVNYNQNAKIKLVTGPIKVDVSIFYISNRGAIKSNPLEKRNNHLFYTLKFLKKNKLSKKHFKLIADKAYQDKLEKRILAPKTIEQIFKK